MRHGAGTRSPSGSGGLGRSAAITNGYEKQLARQEPRRENPLDAPTVLLEVADGPTTDILAVVLHYLGELPQTMRDSFGRHFDPALIDGLRILHAGLDKLRKNESLTYDEVGLLGDPRPIIMPLAHGLRKVARRKDVPQDVRDFVETNISIRLEELASCRLMESAVQGVIQLWGEALYPDEDDPIADPDTIPTHEP